MRVSWGDAGDDHGDGGMSLEDAGALLLRLPLGLCS